MMRRHAIVLLSLLAIVVPGRGQEPDAGDLLRAAGQSRQSIRSGDISFTIVDKAYEISPQSSEVRIRFDGIKRTVSYRQESFRLKSPGGSPASAKEQRAFEALKGDRVKAEKAGLGTRFTDNNAWAFDGQLFCRYQEGEHSSAVYSKWGKEDEFIFEPRLLGLISGYNSSTDLSFFFSEENAKKAKLVAKEVIDGTAAWHITYEGVSTVHYWIEDHDPFRICKSVYEGKGTDLGLRLTITSSFEGTRGPLPTLVSQKSESAKGVVLRESRLKTSKMDLNPILTSSIGSIQSLDLPSGRTVIDNKLNMVLGIWNGKEIVPARDYLKEKQESRKPRTSLHFERIVPWVFILAGVFVLGFVGVSIAIKSIKTRRDR
jgi:hypothetical protein